MSAGENTNFLSSYFDQLYEGSYQINQEES